MVTVRAIAETDVTIDANHPLAGEYLTFEVELVDILQLLRLRKRPYALSADSLHSLKIKTSISTEVVILEPSINSPTTELPE